MDYESQRQAMEDLLKKHKQEARIQYESYQQSTQTLKDGTQVLPSSYNEEYEKKYRDAISAKPDIDQFMKEYEKEKATLREYDEAQDKLHMRAFNRLKESIWLCIEKTNRGTNIYHDSEHNFIWEIDETNIRNGAWKPEQVEYQRIVNSKFFHAKQHFIYLQQPNGYMFELV